MILKDTILSAFTDRITLLRWLKKVEAALKSDTLEDIALTQISATEVKIKLIFADGKYVESPVLTMPQGPQGPQGAPGKDGRDGQGIAATVEVGTTTTGEPGTAAAVVNAGDETRAVLNFTIPRGAKGDKGDAGAGFGNASSVKVNDAAALLETANDGLSVASHFTITAGNETFEIPSIFVLPMKGSESIAIDVNETGDFFTVRMDAAWKAKIIKNENEIDQLASRLVIIEDHLPQFTLEGTTLTITLPA